MHLPARAYPGEAGFFTGSADGELRVGAAHGLAEWPAPLGIKVRLLPVTVNRWRRLVTGV